MKILSLVTTHWLTVTVYHFEFELDLCQLQTLLFHNGLFSIDKSLSDEQTSFSCNKAWVET